MLILLGERSDKNKHVVRLRGVWGGGLTSRCFREKKRLPEAFCLVFPTSDDVVIFVFVCFVGEE